MKRLLILILLFAATAHAQSPTISPSPAAVNQGGTINFSCTANCGAGGTWSCTGCAGSINSSTGEYTAPASVTAQQTVGGRQLLPNNHIYNMRIDGLSVNSNSATWIAGAGSSVLNYLPLTALNYADGSTPVEDMTFFYTTDNNGDFQIPDYPNFKIEHGWFDARTYNPLQNDHHSIVIDTSDGTVQEMYQYYPANTNPDCALCTAASGVRYSADSYDLPSISVDAAGLMLTPLTLRLQEMEQAIATSGEIKHALRFTLNSGFCASSNIWPATTFAADGGTVPFGARARLRSSFDISGYSSIAQIILTQLKHYGIILADGGTGWQPSVESTRWPKDIADAFQEIQTAAIAPSNFEFVDESGLMISSSSGDTTSNRETVTFTRTSDSATASVDVVVRGVAVTLPQDVLNFMAGAPATQLTAFASIGDVTWSMDPSVGTLTSGGLYTPPSTESSPTSTTVTATSDTDGTVAASLTLTVYPQDTIRLLLGQTADYTDSNADVWHAGSPDQCMCDGSNGFGTESAYGYDNGGTWTGTDIQIYKIPMKTLGDVYFDLYVPNGVYSITGKYANNSASDEGDFIVEANGSAGAPVDVFDLVGVNTPHDITNSDISVSNNHLQYVVRAVNSQGVDDAPYISAIEVSKTGSLPASGRGAGMMARR